MRVPHPPRWCIDSQMELLVESEVAQPFLLPSLQTLRVLVWIWNLALNINLLLGLEDQVL